MQESNQTHLHNPHGQGYQTASHADTKKGIYSDKYQTLVVLNQSNPFIYFLQFLHIGLCK